MFVLPIRFRVGTLVKVRCSKEKGQMVHVSAKKWSQQPRPTGNITPVKVVGHSATASQGPSPKDHHESSGENSSKNKTLEETPKVEKPSVNNFFVSRLRKLRSKIAPEDTLTSSKIESDCQEQITKLASKDMGPAQDPISARLSFLSARLESEGNSQQSKMQSHHSAQAFKWDSMDKFTETPPVLRNPFSSKKSDNSPSKKKYINPLNKDKNPFEGNSTKESTEASLSVPQNQPASVTKKQKRQNNISSSLPPLLNVLIDNSVQVETLFLQPEDAPIDEVILPGQKKVPNLAHGLDRVLFNPGITYLRDPRSNIYNFDPYIEKIMPRSEFDYDALHEYITSSRDSNLDSLARQNNCKFVGSTSSMTSTLSHFHFLLSSWRPVSTSTLSTKYGSMARTFTKAQRAPSSIFLRYNNGIYSIDADKSLDTDTNILSWLGRSMEKMFTVSPSVHEKYRKSNSHTLTPAERGVRETFHFSACKNLLMRSQLDCHDPRLPGTGIFDLKTRAVVAVRMDIANAEEFGSGYEIRKTHGEFESFEREYYDLIRSAFLKYSLQVRIGKMDGIFVAYHNVNRIFGFQYISLDEMDLAIHGTEKQNIGDREFKLSILMLRDILEKATARFPMQSMRVMFDTDPGLRNRMYVIVEAMSEERINQHQAGAVRALLEASEGIVEPEAVEKINMELNIELAKELTRKKLNRPTGDTEHVTIRDVFAQYDSVHLSSANQVFGYVIDVESFVNQKVVQGPPLLKAEDSWNVQVQYSRMKDPMEEYIAMLRRRRESYSFSEKDEGPDDLQDRFILELRSFAEKGRKWREEFDKKQQGKPPVVFKTIWKEEPVAMEGN